MNPWIALLVISLALPLPIAAQEITATMLEGSVRVIRGVTVCTYVTEKVPLTGSAKSGGKWLNVTEAAVYFDHPVHTLATQFWAYQRDESYGAAAPYAVVIVALAAVPGYILTTWFDRHPAEVRA